MRMLITGSHGLLGRALVTAFGPRHDVRTLDLVEDNGVRPTCVGDPRDRDLAAQAASGCDVIVHQLLRPRSRASELEILDLATRGTYNLISAAPASSRFILVSSLRLFERYPVEWNVTEDWAPEPTTDSDDLAAYLAEAVVREIARLAPLKAIALRLGNVVDDEGFFEGAGDPRRLHVEDAVQAVERAVDFEPAPDEALTGWWVFHISSGGRRSRFPIGRAGLSTFGYSPRHQVPDGVPVASTSPPDPAVLRASQGREGPPRRVVVYGAGGPLGAVTAEALAHDHALRLTDVRPMADIVAEGRAQSPGAPLPRLHDEPHEMHVVDVTDQAQVFEAARGMEAIVNCSVVRADPVEAFRVNTLGAYNVMRAAVRCGIRRVVHTGPQMVTELYPAGYWYDFDLTDDVPPRPGRDLYATTKFLGQEICRIFAEEHDLEVAALLFAALVNPTYPPRDPVGLFPFAVSWQDAAAAVRGALRVPSFPRPFESYHIVADLPHGKYRNDKAKRLLRWRPHDRLEAQLVRDLN